MNKKFWGSLFKGGLNLLNNAVNGRNKFIDLNNFRNKGLLKGGLKINPKGKKI